VATGEYLNIRGEVDAIFSRIYAIVGIWFVLTYGAILYALIRYRRGRHPQARYTQGNKPVQHGWILALALVVLALDIGIDLRGAELCGFGHTGMMGRLVVHTPEEYEALVKKLWPRLAAPPEQHEEQGEGTNPLPVGRMRVRVFRAFLPCLLVSPLSS